VCCVIVCCLLPQQVGLCSCYAKGKPASLRARQAPACIHQTRTWACIRMAMHAPARSQQQQQQHSPQVPQVGEDVRQLLQGCQVATQHVGIQVPAHSTQKQQHKKQGVMVCLCVCVCLRTTS
jgi:hypothetical protein